MKFSIKEWRRMYDKVNALGAMLIDSRPTYTDNGSYISPVTELSKAFQAELESNIKNIIKRSSMYLDQCGLKISKPCWYYDRDDPRTWCSHESFKYGHLLEF